MPPVSSSGNSARQAVRVPDLRLLHRRQLAQAGVVDRVVDRGVAVELRATRAGGEVEVVVGQLGGGAVGPTVVGRLVHDRPLAVAGGAAVGVGRPGVGRVVGDPDVVGVGVDLDAERVAPAHRVDLRAGLRRARGEQVALRDRVAAAGLGRDPQDLAAQVVGVGRGALGVERGVAVGALVERHEAVGLERVGVVTGRQDQVALPSRRRCRRRRGSRCRGRPGRRAPSAPTPTSTWPPE